MMTERRLVFGDDAEEYDARRPDYPDAMIDDIVASVRRQAPGFSAPSVGSGAGGIAALEVGAGTGKASTAFAARGVDLTCLEPDPRMAAVLRRRVADEPRVRVVEALFEEWTPDRPYGLLVSGQAWHWVDEAKRNDLAAAALGPGGLVALFWNVSLVADRSVYDALAEVDERFGMTGDHTPHSILAGNHPDLSPDFVDDWASLQLHGDPRFTGVHSRRYHREDEVLTSTEYADLIATTSHYRILEPGVRETVLAAVVAAIDAEGGVIRRAIDTDLATATRV
jgi:SAM-dependent methyltransferase